MNKTYLLLLTLIAALVSCNEPGNESTQNKEEALQTGSAKDTTTLDWFKNKNLENTIFYNSIGLADGQHTTAGLAFLLQTDTTPIIVSAVHLLGPAAGFKETIKFNEASETVTEWDLISIPEMDTIETAGEIIDSIGDVLFLKLTEQIDTSGFTIFEPSKIIVSPKNEVSVFINNKNYPLPNKFYLVGYNREWQVVLHPLELASHEDNFLAFRKKTGFDFHGLSGGPIIDSRGRAFGVLYGGITHEGEDFIIGYKIILPEN